MVNRLLTRLMRDQTPVLTESERPAYTGERSACTCRGGTSLRLKPGHMVNIWVRAGCRNQLAINTFSASTWVDDIDLDKCSLILFQMIMQNFMLSEGNTLYK